MPRPEIIRADSLDLQDSDKPSAQDHSRQPARPSPLGQGPPSPHQKTSMQHVAEERRTEQEHLVDTWGSGRSSHEGSDLMNDDLRTSQDSFRRHGDDGESRTDAAALQQNGGEEAEEGEEVDDDGEDDDMDDKISSSPSISDEDIDFEFVYALHQFVATVEGQANATKGETMVLLDDTNSYWWLVRIVKDNTIGYLPAEHIETPTERLARLNKHRNIDLAQSMLGDNPEKSKNPLKKAMRRRNAKVVQFAPPTFYEPSEVDWSETEEDREFGMDGEDGEDVQVNGRASNEEHAKDKKALANGHSDDVDANTMSKDDGEEEIAILVDEATLADGEGHTELDNSDDESEPRASTSSQSKNGTICNTDSFFKDDTVEPKKIILTPELFREDGESARSSETKDRMQDIFDQIDAETNAAAASSEKGKDRKKKDKKSNMLSGLFKRKDKKIKVDEAAGGVVGVKGGDDDSTVSPGDSGRSSPSAPSASTTVPPMQPLNVRRPSNSGKLTKTPPAGLNTKSSKTDMSKTSSEKSPTSPKQLSDSLSDANAKPAPLNTTSNAAAASQAAASSSFPASAASTTSASNGEAGLHLAKSAQTERQNALSSFTSMLTANSSSSDQPKKEKLKPAKQRIELDVDSSPELEPVSTNPFRQQRTPSSLSLRTNEAGVASSLSNDESRNTSHTGNATKDLSPVSPVDNSAPTRQAPTAPPTAAPPSSSLSSSSAIRNGHGQYTHNYNIHSPVSPQTAIEVETDPFRDVEPKSSIETTSYQSERARADSAMTTASSVTTTTPAPATPPPSGDAAAGWNDMALRTYLDHQSNAEVRDLLLVVHDSTGVEPLPQDHPTMIGLGFHQHQKHLNDMSSQLDSLLNGFLARRAASRPRTGSKPNPPSNMAISTSL